MSKKKAEKKSLEAKGKKGSDKKKKSSKKAGRRYGKAASKKVGAAMHERKRGTLRSGPGETGGWQVRATLPLVRVRA